MPPGREDLERRAMLALEEAFERPSPDRVAWARETYAHDPELLARLLSLLNTASSLSGALQTGGASELIDQEIPPTRAGHYAIRSLIGRGGMGAVFLAERDAGDFDHTVAVKVIRPGTLSEALVARFENERRILAKLNHPGIARLFDGGQLKDGSPYIIMEYVEGVPVTQWAETRSLPEAKRLSIFQSVCDAVAYAHQNLVIHRDITPANVLVTPGGEAKLIDFGIAKPKAGDEEIFAGGSGSVKDDGSPESLSFTPGFAAPERSRGAPANTLSDIYSLGKLLQALLGETIDDDLKAIIAKSTQADPSKRYPSVTALSEDVTKYLEGYPVEARQGGNWYRWSKYFARRRLLVVASTGAVLALVGALVITLVQYQRAETALTRANERFEQARELSRSLIFDTYDDFSDIAGTLEARRELVSLVDAYVTRLATDNYAPEDVLFDVGVMNKRLSDLYGGVGVANLGDTGLSAERLLAADKALRTLLATHRDNQDALAELILVGRNRSMQALLYDIDPVMAMAINDEVIANAGKGLAQFPDDERPFLRHLWSARTDRIQILREMGELEKALGFLQDWRGELDKDMFERLGGGEEMAAYMAMQEAEVLNELGRPREAFEPLQYALDYREKQLEAEPGNYYQQTQLMVAYMVLAQSRNTAGDPAGAVETSDRAVDLARQIMAADDTDAGGPEGLTSALTNHALYLYQSERQDEAMSAASEAASLAEGLVARFPDDIYYGRIALRTRLSGIEVSGGRIEDAAACAELAEAGAEARSLSEGGADEDALDGETGEQMALLKVRHNCPG